MVSGKVFFNLWSQRSKGLANANHTSGASFIKNGGNMTLKEKVLADPSVRYWVKDQIRNAEKRDIVDAIKDADLLILVLQSENATA